ncbi:MAG: hypothetical protein KDI16_11180 [Halioglobus sp.]|nr:hypothetical protein [Halioglobus sp.]
MLKITDLTASKELDSRDMAGVRGGMDPFAMIDFSTDFVNKVADVQQTFGFEFAQGNLGTVTNNQTITGGNGLAYAPVEQNQSQYNDLYVAGVGNVAVG